MSDYRIEDLLAEIERLQIHSSVLMREIDRLREQLASLQASSGYEASIAQVEIERLKAALQEIVELQGRVISEAGKAMRAHNIARRALEPKP